MNLNISSVHSENISTEDIFEVQFADNISKILIKEPKNSRVNLLLARYVAVLQAIISLYIFFALVYYAFKKRRSSSNYKANNLCLLASAFCVLTCVARLAELWLVIVTCYAYHLIATLMYGVGLGLVYTTLWLRQRKLYSDKLLQHTVTNLSRKFSSAIIVVIYCLLITVFATFITVLQFETLYPPCHIVWYPLSSLLPLLVFFIFTCFFLQLFLFILIVNPLKKESGICSVLLCTNSQNDVFLMLKRLAVCACACVCSTIFLSIALLLDALEIICIYWGNLVSLDLIICILASSFSFQDWDRRLLPLCPRIQRRRRRFRHSVVLNETSIRSSFRRTSARKVKTSIKRQTRQPQSYYNDS